MKLVLHDQKNLVCPHCCAIDTSEASEDVAMKNNKVLCPECLNDYQAFYNPGNDTFVIVE